MHSKLDYLKRYSRTTRKKMGKDKKSNLFVVDDDVNWKLTSLDANLKVGLDEESDEAPVVAEIQDESIMKWHPLSKLEKNYDTPSEESFVDRSISSSLKELKDDLSPPRKDPKISWEKAKDLSPPRKLPTKLTSSRIFLEASEIGSERDESNSETSRRKLWDKIKTEEPDLSGKFAETVYRDKTERKSLHDDEVMSEDFKQWGRGVVQTKTAAEKVQEENYEMSKPFSRYVDDVDLEKMLKERSRDGDPMLNFMKKKKKNIGVITAKGKLKFKGSSDPNRFGIFPGYRWDGVNRSNGFEKAWFAKESNKKAIEEVSYKWSVEDM